MPRVSAPDEEQQRFQSHGDDLELAELMHQIRDKDRVVVRGQEVVHCARGYCGRLLDGLIVPVVGHPDAAEVFVVPKSSKVLKGI